MNTTMKVCSIVTFIFAFSVTVPSIVRIVYASNDSDIHPKGDYYIVGGSNASLGEIPWIVAIHGSGLCAGSIYNERTIITAAHCDFQ